MNNHTGKRTDILNDPFVLTTGRFQPGGAKDYCQSTISPLQRQLGLAELAYYRGELDEAYDAFSSLLGQEDFSTYISSLLGRALCDLARGKTKEMFSLIQSAKNLADTLPDDSGLKRVCDLFLIYINIVLHNFTDLELPQVSVDAFDMPDSLRMMAFYVYTHYLMSTEDVGRAIGLAEAALVCSGRSCPVSEIYLSLNISIGYMLRQTWDKAEYYFLHAWHLAEPDGIIMPFVELRGMLSGMLEKCLRRREPNAYKIISEYANNYHRSWVSVHNELTGDLISDRLTAIEFNVATLAAHGLSNTEISDFTGVSVNSIRAHMRNIFNKLGIDSRKELRGFVI